MKICRNALVAFVALSAASCGKLSAPAHVADNGNDGESAADLAAVYHQIEAAVPVALQRDALSDAEIASLYAGLVNNPVSDLDVIGPYDPTGAIGYCYGRAMAAQLTAARLGLKPESMRKLFMVGDMRSNPTKREWRFHVTTLVLNDQGAWIAIDPIMERYPFFSGAIPAAEWVANVRGVWDSWQKDASGAVVHKAKMYVTPVNAVLPDIRTVYAQFADEPGDRLIQLNFDPTTHQGFAPSASVANAFDVSSAAAKAFFLAVDEDAADRFDFFGIKLLKHAAPAQDQTIDLPYNNYFVDLLAFLKDSSIAKLLQPGEGAANLALTEAAGAADLRSMKFD